MKKLIAALVVMMVVVGMCGCAATLPTTAYTPQNFARVQGEMDMGEFVYIPFVEGIVKKSNQIQNTAAGTLYISMDVADFVKRGTALELEKSGIFLSEQCPYALSGNILEFKADDLGYSVDWKYAIQYKIINKTDNATLFDKTFRPSPKKTGKFGLPSDYANTAGEMILSGYDLFIRDPDVRRIVEKAAYKEPPLPESAKKMKK